MKTSRRIYIGAGSNGFLGGNPPEGVEPSHRKSSFFATVEASKDRWLSVFLQDYWTLEQSLTLDRVVALPGSIELIEHTGKVGRKAASRHVSGLSAHTLRLGPASNDLVNGEPLFESKLGGTPHFSPMSPGAKRDLAECSEKGFVHYVQFSFGGGMEDDVVEGSWPFGDRVTSFFRSGTNSAKPAWRVFWRGL